MTVRSRGTGAPGLRDQGLLESGCVRAINRTSFRSTTLPEIAAAYAFGIITGHANVDGNKRTAFVTAVIFLRPNGYGFLLPPVEGVRMMEALATDEVQFAHWLSKRMAPT